MPLWSPPREAVPTLSFSVVSREITKSPQNKVNIFTSSRYNVQSSAETCREREAGKSQPNYLSPTPTLGNSCSVSLDNPGQRRASGFFPKLSEEGGEQSGRGSQGPVTAYKVRHRLASELRFTVRRWRAMGLPNFRPSSSLKERKLKFTGMPICINHHAKHRFWLKCMAWGYLRHQLKNKSPAILKCHGVSKGYARFLQPPKAAVLSVIR